MTANLTNRTRLNQAPPSARGAVGMIRIEGVAAASYPSGMKLDGIIHSDPEIMGGTPVFVGTRVPLQNLVDYLEGGESIEDFLDGFPGVKREQVIAVIEAGKMKMLEIVADAHPH